MSVFGNHEGFSADVEEQPAASSRRATITTRLITCPYSYKFKSSHGREQSPQHLNRLGTDKTLRVILLRRVHYQDLLMK
jgi:hypothetical protein